MSARPRYRLDPLFALMRMPPNAALLHLGVDGSRKVRYIREGVSDVVADRLAVKAGFHPFTVWPDLAEHTHADVQRRCDDCGTAFVPYRPAKDRYCSPACGVRARQRKRYRKLSQSARWRKAERARQAAYRAEVRAIRSRRKSTALMSEDDVA